MKVEVTMPQMGESVAEGTIVKWHKQIGDSVEKDETILEISTDKVDSEIPSPVSGTLAEIKIDEGETVEVGTVIAFIETEKIEEIPSKEEPKQEAEKKKEPPKREEKISEKIEASLSREEGDRFLSPLVRKIIQEENISKGELGQVQGSGKDGRITKDDILAFIQQRKVEPTRPAPPPKEYVIPEEKKAAPPPPEPVKPEYKDEHVEIIQMDHVRKAIAAHMVRSIQTSPHVATFAEIDMSRIVNYREQIKNQFEQRNGFKLTYTAFFVEAAAKALKEFPYLNASVDGDKIILRKYINIGVAVAVGQKLIVPVIKNADQKSLVGIARATHELTEKARNKQLIPDDVQGGTFSITNPGIFGNTVGVAIINQPQVAILDCGAIKKRAVVINDAIGIRPIMVMSLSYDHRIIDGAMASLFSQKIVRYLEDYEPEGF